MDPYDRVRIQKNLKPLAENILVEDILPSLIQDLVLTYEDRETILHEITKRDRAMKCIELLQTRGPDAYKSFRNALQDEYGFLVTLLDRAHVSEEDIIKSSPSSAFLNRLDTPERPNRISRNFSEEMKELQDELRTYYTGQMRYMAPVPWLESFQVEMKNVYTDPQIVRALNRNAKIKADRRTSSSEEDAVIDPVDLFGSIDEGRTLPRKILIEGEPGIGKSTFCNKILFDWATMTSGKDHPLSRFDLVLALKARDLENRKSILKCAFELLFPEDFTLGEDDIRKIITNNQDRVLILVDGYDEFMEQHTDFAKLMTGKIMSHISILVTSRPGFATNMLKYFDTIFVMVGYGEAQRLQFIDKFAAELCEEDAADGRVASGGLRRDHSLDGQGKVHKKQYEDFKARLVADDVLSQLCRNPLHLCILCMLLQDNQTGELPKTKTELYMEMEDFIIKRAAECVSLSEDEFRKKCSPLSKIAYQGLLDNRHTVTEEEIKKHCDVASLKHLGFFSKQITMSVKPFKQVAHYTFTHKSFQEYFAAKYIAAPKKTKQERLDMAGQLLKSGHNKLVMVFLCGLLQTDNQLTVIELLDTIQAETYLPLISTERLSLHDVNENHNSHTLFHCLREVETLPEKLGPKLMECKIVQICLSYPWCSAECMEGILKLCGVIDRHCILCFTPKTLKNTTNNMIDYSKGDQAKPKSKSENIVKIRRPQTIYTCSLQSGEVMINSPGARRPSGPVIGSKSGPSVMVRNAWGVTDNKGGLLPRKPSGEYPLRFSDETTSSLPMDFTIPSPRSPPRTLPKPSSPLVQQVIQEHKEAKSYSFTMSDNKEFSTGGAYVASARANETRQEHAEKQEEVTRMVMQSFETRSLERRLERADTDSNVRRASAEINEKSSTLDSKRPRSLETLLDDERPIQKSQTHSFKLLSRQEQQTQGNKRTQNMKIMYQRAMAMLRKNPVAVSPLEQSKCKKFSVTFPGPLVSERSQLFEKFIRQLMDSRHVEAICMHDVSTDQQVQTLFKVLAGLGRPRITALTLRFQGVLDPLNSAARVDTTYFHWVQSLSIIECPSPELLCGLIESIPPANSIRYLSFTRCRFHPRAMKALCSKLQHMKTLKTFDFCGNDFLLVPHITVTSGPEAAGTTENLVKQPESEFDYNLEILNALQDHTHLVHFGLSGLTSKPSAMKASDKRLQIVPKDDDHMQSIAPQLRKITSSNKLESFFLSNSKLGTSLLQILHDAVRSSKTLQKLMLLDNQILPTGQPLLTNLLQSVVRGPLASPSSFPSGIFVTHYISELNFIGTELSDEHFEAVGEIMKTSVDLKQLSLGLFNVNDMLVFSEGLRRNQSLNYLEICKIIFYEDSILPFSNAISLHPKLNTLILSTNDMVPVKINNLFQAIKCNHNIQTISLRHFHFEDLHMIEMSHVLRHSENIVKVNLQSNLIGPVGVDHLYKKIQYRTNKLWQLDLSDNNVKEYHNEVKLLKTQVLYLKVNWF